MYIDLDEKAVEISYVSSERDTAGFGPELDSDGPIIIRPVNGHLRLIVDEPHKIAHEYSMQRPPWWNQPSSKLPSIL